ncbi:MAG: 2-oxo acid dehydrogenase subunit E2, partial [Micromonosporaceae bacterium]
GGNLGFGRIVERPVVKDGAIVAAPVLPLSISADHRLVDGDTLAGFAGTVSELIEKPILMLGGMP